MPRKRQAWIPRYLEDPRWAQIEVSPDSHMTSTLIGAISSLNPLSVTRIEQLEVTFFHDERYRMYLRTVGMTHGTISMEGTPGVRVCAQLPWRV